jgi:hypothetical protein
MHDTARCFMAGPPSPFRFPLPTRATLDIVGVNSFSIAFGASTMGYRVSPTTFF